MNNTHPNGSFIKKNWMLIVAFGVTIVLVVVMTSIPFKMNELLDWKALDQQIRTNQTLTNSMDCDKVNYYYNEAKMLIFTPHPEIVKDFADLAKSKQCPFIKGESP